MTIKTHVCASREVLMTFTLTYVIGNEKLTTQESNHHVTITRTTSSWQHGQRLTVTIKPEQSLTLVSAVMEEPLVFDNDTVFMLNGYQSWTETREFTTKDRMRGLDHLPRWLLHKYQLRQYGDLHIAKTGKRLFHGFTYGYIRNQKQFRLTGSLNDQEAFLVIYHDLANSLTRLESDVEGLVLDSSFTLFDVLFLEGTHDEVFDTYMRELPQIGERPVLIGYTSWYNYYQHISEQILLDDLDALQGKYNLFQIDDGYQTYIGDWLDVNLDKLPNGLMPIKTRIEDKKMMPGIWLAPFVCEKKSRVYREHPEWVAKDRQGRAIMGGSNWSGFMVLDLELEAVRNHIKKALHTMRHTYGFTFFKLDFLYAAALPSRPHQTRAQAMHQALLFIRECLPDAYILGCGMPLSSGFGLVDYCRIGPDISLLFDDVWYMKWMHRERISTKQAILNTIYRRELDKRVFYNDPDVYLLRNHNIRLSTEQKEALLVINALFGSVLLTSDNVSTLSLRSKTLFQTAKQLLKATDKTVTQHGHMIEISYVLEGRHENLVYDSRRGVLTRWSHVRKD
ncbi:MAG: alpha-galactosidase [Acholeplasmataceae bacterium]|nr:MAG: alpha-galactosidase [Acholeplasmataceae bacterium]